MPTGLRALRNREIGFVFQQFNLLPRIDALGNVELPMIYAGMRPQDPPRARPARARTRRPRRPGASPPDAVVRRPAAARRDRAGARQQPEPAARRRADRRARQPAPPTEILALFQELNREGATIVLVTHDADVGRHARRLVRFRDGTRDRGSPPGSRRCARLDDGGRRMRLIEAIRSALSAIMANALRSLLTMLGIVIGVAAVIAMVAIGAGARNLVDRQIRSLGANLAIVTPGNVTQGGARLGAGAASSLTDDDARRDPARGRRRGRGRALRPGTARRWWPAAATGRRASTASISTGLTPANGMSRTAAASTRKRSAAATSSSCSAQTVARNLFGDGRSHRSDRARAQRAVPRHRRDGAEGPIGLRPGPGRRDLRAARCRPPPRDRPQLRQGRLRRLDLREVRQ